MKKEALDMRRRFFFLAAPAIVAASSLMPISMLPQTLLAATPAEATATIIIGRKVYREGKTGWELVETLSKMDLARKGSWQQLARPSIDNIPAPDRLIALREEDYAKQAAFDARLMAAIERHKQIVLVATSPQEVPEIKRIAAENGYGVYNRVDPFHGERIAFSPESWELAKPIDDVLPLHEQLWVRDDR